MDERRPKMNPVRRIAEEVEPHSTLSADDINESLIRTMDLLKERAEREIDKDAESPAATASAMDFLAFTEMLTLFGSSLMSYDEVTAATSGSEKGLMN